LAVSTRPVAAGVAKKTGRSLNCQSRMSAAGERPVSGRPAFILEGGTSGSRRSKSASLPPATRQEAIMETTERTGVARAMEQGQDRRTEGAPFKLKDIWALRVRLQMAHRIRELALFNLGIDRKLGGCDLVKLRSATSATATR
jgi:hypothetical protein